MFCFDKIRIFKPVSENAEETGLKYSDRDDMPNALLREREMKIKMASDVFMENVKD